MAFKFKLLYNNIVKTFIARQIMKDFSCFLENLKKLISYKSTLGENKANMPFGKECYNALNYFLAIASKMGFETINYDNYIGEVRFGKGEEIGIIGHLDVVPTGIGWDSDPFTLTEKDGVYYARGIVDDKTAPLLCLYALKELKDSGLSSNRTFRLFIGCNEESGWKDIDYLKTKTTLPEYGFSPDGNFPLSYAEKGITEIEFCFPSFKNFSALSGGTALNAVCDHATAVCKTNNLDLTSLKAHGLTINGNKIESFGKASHGSTPHLGKNAILPLLKFISQTEKQASLMLNILFYEGGILKGLSNEQGDTTLSPNLLREESGYIYVTCDCRIPAPLSTQDVKAFLDTLGVEYTTNERHPPMMAEKEGWFVTSLLNAYDFITGEKSKPFSMGGSTFARAFKKGCAFGPEFKDKEYNIHDANEHVSKDDLLKSYQIYKTAIFNLAKID